MRMIYELFYNNKNKIYYNMKRKLKCTILNYNIKISFKL